MEMDLGGGMDMFGGDEEGGGGGGEYCDSFYFNSVLSVRPQWIISHHFASSSIRLLNGLNKGRKL